MKLKELLSEMPWHKEEDLTTIGAIPDHLKYFPLDEFEDGYEILSNRMVRNQQTIVAIAHDKSSCIAALVEGDKVVTQCILEFQGITFETDLKGPLLQVDLVQADQDAQGYGYGYEIYKAILNQGYTLISDYVQYNGGRRLWEKILRKAGQDGHHVMVLRHGMLMRDANGEPIKYNGANIPTKEIWGGRERQDTLLVAAND